MRGSYVQAFIAATNAINALEQPVQLPLETAHPMPFMMAVVALIVNAVMVMRVMACTGAAQERHRTIEELFFRDGTVLVGVEHLEQDLARRAARDVGAEGASGNPTGVSGASTGGAGVSSTAGTSGDGIPLTLTHQRHRG